MTFGHVSSTTHLTPPLTPQRPYHLLAWLLKVAARLDKTKDRLGCQVSYKEGLERNIAITKHGTLISTKGSSSCRQD